MDEPTSGLDPLMQPEVYSLLREARAAGATVFFSSHILREAETLAERAAIIRQGVIVDEARPAELAGMPLRSVRLHLKEAVDPERLTSVKGVTPLYFYQGGKAAQEIKASWLAGLLVAGLLLVGLALVPFQRRDIRVSGERRWSFPFRGRLRQGG